uniref:Uncharacterized protein n=1 Tax=Podarcis muralis TaxID=64176 RepID=A0A670JQX8_PODMU
MLQPLMEIPRSFPSIFIVLCKEQKSHSCFQGGFPSALKGRCLQGRSELTMRNKGKNIKRQCKNSKTQFIYYHLRHGCSHDALVTLGPSLHRSSVV